MPYGNYIQKYYQLSKCSAKLPLLKIKVLGSIYNQYYEIFLKTVTGRQAEHVTKKLCKLWFFIHFNCSLENSKLNSNLLAFSIGSNNKNQLVYYKNILKNIKLIEVHKEFKKYTKDNVISYNQENDSYSYNERESNLDFSSNTYIDLVYTIVDNSYIKQIGSLIKNYNNNPIPYIHVSSSQLTVSPAISCTSRCSFSFEEYLQIYSRLNYKNLVGEIDAQLSDKLHYSVASLHDDNRVYHYFHSIPSSLRQSRVFLDNEVLVEAFDIHNSQHTLLNCLLDDTIPETEKDRWYNLTISGKFYEDLRDWVNRTSGGNWSREDAKLYANKYYNIKNKSLDKAKESKSTRFAAEVWVDKYFEDVFPNVRLFIYSNKEGLHNRINQIETNIMIYSICKELYENYGIEAITVHDGLYMKQSDYNYLITNKISISQMFLNYLTISKFI